MVDQPQLFSDLSERCKRLERRNAVVLPQTAPWIIRLDGKKFSSWTKPFERPHDERLCNAFRDTTKRLMSETNAVFGYTQSDEITLIIFDPHCKSQWINGGKVNKITSLTASMCTAFFNGFVKPTRSPAFFDSRVWLVDSLDDAVDVVTWRYIDAKRNSINNLAQKYFSHKRLENRKSHDKLRMLNAECDIDWHNCPNCQKYGIALKKTAIEKELTKEELEKIPLQYRPTGPVLRPSIEEVKDLHLFCLLSREDKKKLIFG